MDRTGTLWAPVLEWSLENPSWSGNPFDLEATVTFTHADSGETRTTAMFHDGENIWRFRFTGTRTGTWTFRTTADDPDLDGRRGTVTIHPNPDPAVRGFLTHAGNQYAVMRGHSTDLEGYLFTVYMDRVEHESSLDQLPADPERMAATTRAYLDTARANGCEVLFLHVNNNWLQWGERRHDRHNSVNPDPKSFRLIEAMITAVHQAGGRVHIWKWGDEDRRWTPIGLPGGANGETDRRLQRYIGARLGPLPGWSMGYGFDLHEWTNQRQVNEWAAYMQRNMGWPHLLCARGFPLDAPQTIHSYDGYDRRAVPLRTSNAGPTGYAEIVEHMDHDTRKPHFYEERHTFNRPGHANLDMDGTRRLLWWSAMAGGMGGFIGFYPQGSSPFGGHPYPNPEQLRAYHAFWHTHGRFVLGMERANECSPGGAYLLRTGDMTRWVIYQEDTNAIEVDLSRMKGPQPAVAVDVRMEYAETDLGTFEAGRHTFRLPAHSDWAIALGTFEGRSPIADGPAHPTDRPDTPRSR